MQKRAKKTLTIILTSAGILSTGGLLWKKVICRCEDETQKHKYAKWRQDNKVVSCIDCGHLSLNDDIENCVKCGSYDLDYWKG